MNIKPLYDNLVVKKDDDDAVSAGGIILTGDGKEKPNQGTIIAIGDGKLLDNGELEPIPLEVGQRVVFNQHADNPVNVDGEEYHVMKYKDIFGVVV